MKFSLVLGLILVALATTNAQKKVVCYWGSWSTGLLASNIDANICTHIIYSFIGVTAEGAIAALPNNPIDTRVISSFIALKSKNPRVKLMVAVGGDSFGSSTFSRLAKSSTARLEFAKNIISFLQRFKFDGLDLDWEYPVIRSDGVDKANFVTLLTILKSQLTANNLIFSIAVAASKWATDQAYDIPKIQAQVDFINLMTYDLHGSWEKVAGHNAPLFDDDVSVDLCVQNWINNGAPREKLILGVAAYGQLFSLTTQNNNFGAPADNVGTMTYNSICQNRWQRFWGSSKQVPYKVNGNQWVGYDDKQSIGIKAQYSKNQNLGGVMIWSLENDDYSGSCREGTFPLTRTMYDITMLGNAAPTGPVAVINPVPIIIPAAPLVTVNPTISKPFQCPTQSGLYPDPTNCFKYYSCGHGIAYSMPCNDGLKWNKVNQYCDHPQNVQC